MKGFGSNRAWRKGHSAKRPAGRAQPVKPPAAITTKTSAQRFHVLLVEDHEPTRLALAQLLVRRRYRVTPAASCAKARSLMEKNKDFHLLISDIGLPDGSGCDLMNEFREKFDAKGIALTGHDTEQDITQSQASGFTTHLTKPVSIESLENALAVVLTKTARRIFTKNGMPR
jgi:CheY-like chemotaxis protein